MTFGLVNASFSLPKWDFGTLCTLLSVWPFEVRDLSHKKQDEAGNLLLSSTAVHSSITTLLV